MIRLFIFRMGWSSVALLLCLFASRPASAQSTGNALLLPVKLDGKWGYADTSRNIVIAPRFDAANFFQGPVAVVEMSKKAYAIDRSGRILTPGFDQLIQVEDTILSIYLNMSGDTLGGWGLSTISGRTILKPAYDEIVELTSAAYAFRKDTLWGVINRSGQVLVPVEYDSVSVTSFGSFLVSKNKNFGLYSRTGKRYVDPVCQRIYWLSTGLIAAREKEGWGVFDTLPQRIVPARFDTLLPVNRFFIAAKEKDSLSCYFALAPGNPTPPRYQNIAALNVRWAKLLRKGSCELADSLGNIIIPPGYGDILAAGNANWFVTNKTGQWGMCGPAGTELIAPRYRFIQPFRGNVTVAIDSAGQGLINHRGQVLVPPGNQQIIIRGFIVKLLHPDNSATIITVDEDGNIVDRVTYDEFRVIRIGGSEGGIVVGPRGGGAIAPVPARVDSLRWFFDTKTNLWGLANVFSGDTVIGPRFKSITPAARFLTRVELPDTVAGPYVDGVSTWAEQRCGLVNDTTGAYVLKPSYVNILIEDLGHHGFTSHVRATLPNGTMALVSLDGKETRTVYSWIEKPQQGYARFCTGGKWTLDEKGEVITNVNKFVEEQRLNGRMSFGLAFIVSDFKAKPVMLAGGKWGYLDSTGAVIVSNVYDAAKPSFAATGIVREGKKWGLVDMTGMMKLPCAYDGLAYLRTDNDTSALVIAHNSNLRYGFLDCNGRIVVPADLKQTAALGNGYIGFTRTGKWGVMNAKGETVCAESYHEILPFSGGYAAVRKGNRWGYIDTLGTEVIAPVFEKAGPFCSGLARVLKNQRWGFIDPNGMLVVEAKFLFAGDFIGASAPVRTRDGFGLIGKDGKWVMKPKWRKITPLEGAPLFVVHDDFARGLCRPDGKMLISPRFEAYTYLGEGLIAYRAGLFTGLADTAGKIMSGAVYEKIRPFSEGLAATCQNGKWGYLRPTGKYAVPPKYRVATQFGNNRAYVSELGNGGCFIDSTGRVVFRLKEKYVSAMPFHEGKSRILYKKSEREMKWRHYYMTQHGVRLNHFEYEETHDFQDGVARVYTGNRWGLVSFTGYYIVKPRYSYIDAFENGMARFQMRTISGLYTLDGKEVLPMQYDWISYDASAKLITYERANRLGYLFRDGRICWPESE